MKKIAPVCPWSASMKSNNASSGSFFCASAISERRLPCHCFKFAIDNGANQNSARSATSQINVLPILCVVAISRVSNVRRVAGSFSLLTIFSGPTFQGPRRQTCTQRSTAGHVWINVSGDSRPCLRAPVRSVEHLGHAAPVLFVGSLEVPDFCGDIRAAGNLEYFLHRIINRVGFAALMRHIDAAILMGHFCQFDDFVCLCKSSRDILKRSRKSEAPSFIASATNFFICLEFGGRRADDCRSQSRIRESASRQQRFRGSVQRLASPVA